MRIAYKFYKICSICSALREALAVKIWMNLFKAYKLWGFKFKVLGSLKCAPSSETMRRISKDFEVQDRAQGLLSSRQVW